MKTEWKPLFDFSNPTFEVSHFYNFLIQVMVVDISKANFAKNIYNFKTLA